MRILRCASLLLTILTCFTCGVRGCGRGSIYILNNEYKQILIAISENVAEDTRIIDRLKDVFTQASTLLYSVTRARAYFKEITILVPKTWSYSPEYQPVANETVDKSDVLVDLPDPLQLLQHKPFVIRTTPCGQLGYYMHLTPTYLIDQSVAEIYGPYDKVLIHEWSHLRYGVYDEYPLDNRSHFYATTGGKIEATRCSRELTGDVVDSTTGLKGCEVSDETGLINENCRFEDHRNGFDRSYGSLMYRQYLSHISEYCDNDPSRPRAYHNSEAPTEQNKHCAGKSSWEVIDAHPDFFNGVNPPNDVSSTVPTFRVVREQEAKRTVLILDISGSMNDNDRMTKLNQGCNNFVMTGMRDGEYLGIVVFNSKASSTMEMTVVNNNTRPGIVALLPTNGNGGTSIGSGVREAIDMFNRGSGTAGGICIVVSDGEENTIPFIDDVIDEVVDSGMTCHTIGITNDADLKMEKLAQLTGGLSFLYPDTDVSNAINEAFAEIGELGIGLFEQKYPLKSVSQSLGRYETLTQAVVVDAALGRDTEFIFDYSVNNGITVTVISPSNKTYHAENSAACVNQVDYLIYTCSFAGDGESGTWVYEVTNNKKSSQRVGTMITSKPRTNEEYPIIAHAYWGLSLVDVQKTPPDTQRLYASVSKGYIPVINAVVKAEVELPSGSVITLQLHDTGSGADLNKDDGVYSAFFLDFDGDKRYNVKMKVDSSEVTMVEPSRVVGTGAASPVPLQTPVPVIPAGDFQRQITGGSFTLTGYDNRVAYMPGRITDLSIVSVNITSHEVQLTWTAQGKELDRGSASYYDLRYSRQSEYLRTETNYSLITPDMLVDIAGINSTNTLANPQPAGYIETIRIQFPQENDVTYYMVVVPRDTDGRDVTGDMSNIVSVSMAKVDLTVSSSSQVAIGLTVGIFIYLLFVALLLFIALAIRPFKLYEVTEDQGAAASKQTTAVTATKKTTSEVKQKKAHVINTNYYRSAAKPIVVTETKTVQKTEMAVSKKQVITKAERFKGQVNRALDDIL